MKRIAIALVLLLSSSALCQVTQHTLTSGGSTTDGTTYTTAAVSPAANNLQLLCVVTGDGTSSPQNPTAVSGVGLTFTLVNSRTSGNPGRRVGLWRALSGSPSTGAVTITFSATQQVATWTWSEFGNVDTGGTNGANAIVQNAQNGCAGCSSLSVTLAAFSSLNNATYGCFGSNHTVAHTPGSGFTQIGTTSQSTPSTRVSAEWRSDNDTTVDVSDGSGLAYSGVAAEIKQAAAGGGGLADNRYCDTDETTNFNPTTDGPATLPQTCVRTATSDTPSPGATLSVTSGSFTDLQNKVTSASCGDTIVLPAAGTYTGTLSLPDKTCSASQWITIVTDQVNNANFPLEGTRATPCQINQASVNGYPSYSCASPARRMPLLQCTAANCVVLDFASGADHYRIIGLELYATGSTNSYLANLANTDHVILDRMVIHGPPNPTFGTTSWVKGGVQTKGATYWAIIDSWIYDTMCTANCTDSQAIAGGVGSVGGGPGKTVNNLLASSGESFLFGGSASTAAPGDIEIRRNHSYKPITLWKLATGGSGPHPVIKNLGEFKNAQRVLVEGNVLEHNWQGWQGDQDGSAVLVTPKNQAVFTTATVNTTSPTTITRVSGTAWQSDTTRVRIAGIWYTVTSFVNSSTLLVTPDPGNNTNVSADRVCRPGSSPDAKVEHVTFRYNLVRHARNGISIATVVSDCLDTSKGYRYLSVHDSLFDDINGPVYTNASAGCCTGGYGVRFGNGQSDPLVWPTDVKIDHVTVLSTGYSGGTWNGLGMINAQTGIPDLIPNITITNNIGPSPFGGFTGSSVTFFAGGVTGILNQVGCSGHNPPSGCTWTWIQNVLAGPSVWTGQQTNTPIPDNACGTGGETCTPSDFTGVFVNYNNGNGGDYHLSAGSPYNNAGTDGRDLGADVDAVLEAINGVD